MAFTLIFGMKMGSKSQHFGGQQRVFKIKDVIILGPFIITTRNFLCVKPFGHSLGMHKNNSHKMHDKLI